MSTTSPFRCWWLGLVLLIGSIGCTAQPPTLQGSLDETGLHLQVEPVVALDYVALLDPAGEPVQTWEDLPALAKLDLPVAVAPGIAYTLESAWRGRALPPLTLAAPPVSEAPIRITLEAFGQQAPITLVPPADLPPTLVLPDGESRLILTLVQTGAVAGTTTLLYPNSLMPDSGGARSQRHQIPLERQGQSYAETLTVRLNAAPQELELLVQFEPAAGPGLREWPVTVQLVPLDSEELATAIRVHEARYPAPLPGGPPPPLKSGLILLPHPFWNQVAASFGLPRTTITADAPLGATRLQLENTTAIPLTCALTGTVTLPGSTEPAAAFAPATWLASGGSAQVTRLLTLPPGPTTVDLPLFVRPEVAGGEYLLTVRGALLGSDLTLFTEEVPLQVQRTSAIAAATIAGAVLLALLVGIWAIPGQPRLFASFTARELMLIALIAALLTGGGLVSGIANTALMALLGPFNVFVGELVTELWSACCVLVLIALIPRPGAFALVATTSFLLRGLLAGELHLIGLIVLGATIALTEAGLWLGGLTSSVQLLRRYPQAPILVTLVTILALGIADALMTWVQLAFAMGLYRLMYAGWYLVATVAITGFGYTSLGVVLSLPFALDLKRIHA